MATPAYKTCPWCSETVRFAARKCRHCGEMLTSQSAKIANLDPKIVTIAETQKAVMFVILGQLASFFVVMFVPEAATLILLVVGVVSLVFILKFFIATLGGGLGTVMCILTLIPCVGMIVLLIGNAIATSKLKAAGIEVGLMGADTSQFS